VYVSFFKRARSVFVPNRSGTERGTRPHTKSNSAVYGKKLLSSVGTVDGRNLANWKCCVGALFCVCWSDSLTPCVGLNAQHRPSRIPTVCACVLHFFFTHTHTQPGTDALCCRSLLMVTAATRNRNKEVLVDQPPPPLFYFPMLVWCGWYRNPTPFQGALFLLCCVG
jgi:hypothetical protein